MISPSQFASLRRKAIISVYKNNTEISEGTKHTLMVAAGYSYVGLLYQMHMKMLLSVWLPLGLLLNPCLAFVPYLSVTETSQIRHHTFQGSAIISSKSSSILAPFKPRCYEQQSDV